jgi:hypothetical protein
MATWQHGNIPAQHTTLATPNNTRQHFVIPDSGAMTKFDISSNDIRAEGGKSLAAGLKGNQVITELNISSNDLGKNAEYDDDTSGIIAIADAIPDMGALSTLIFGGDQYLKSMTRVDPAPATLKVGMTEANFSNKNLGPGGAIIILAWISHRDNGALSKLVMRQNNIHGAEAGKVFSNMLAQNTVLKELDLSSQKVGNRGHALDADFAKEFAVGISDNGAISVVNLEENNIQFSNELCMTLLRCAIDSRCGLRIKVEEGNDFSVVKKHTMEFVLLEMFGKENIPTEVNVESAGLTGITIAQ